MFHDYIDEFMVVYLDDVVIYSECLEDHLHHLRLPLTRVREHELYVKLEKCEFIQKTILFLGHQISMGEVRMDQKKVEPILDWPAPTKVPELRSFLGLVNYHRKFIKDYSNRAIPLTDLLKKDHP